MADITKAYSSIVSDQESVKNDIIAQKDKAENLRNKLTRASKNPNFNPHDEVLISMTEEMFQAQELVKINEQALISITEKVNQVKEAMNVAERELQRLKLERTKVVNTLKQNMRVERAFNTINGVQTNGNLEKLLDAVQEGVKETTARSLGSQIVHDEMISTKIERAHRQAINCDAQAFLESLKKN